MKAMVLAAGEGRRLRPLTDKTPKALVEVGGVPMLEGVVRRLIAAGVDQVVVNVFHLTSQVEDFIKKRKGFGIRVEVSREDVLLDTGGGLKKASWFFDDGKPFLLHNVDVLSDVDLRALYAAHLESGALATVAVHERESDRRLLFDRDGRLCGRRGPEGEEWAARPVPGAETLAFAGIHAISPALFPKMTETGVFSILKPYLRLAGLGEDVRAFRVDGRAWADIGDAAKLEKARKEFGGR